MGKSIYYSIIIILLISCMQQKETFNSTVQPRTNLILDSIISEEIKLYRTVIPNGLFKSRLNIWRISQQFGPSSLTSIPLDDNSYIDYFEFDLTGPFKFGEFNSRNANILHRKLYFNSIDMNMGLFEDSIFNTNPPHSNLYYTIICYDERGIARGGSLKQVEANGFTGEKINAIMSKVSAIEELNFLLFNHADSIKVSKELIDSLSLNGHYLVNSEEMIWKPNKNW